MIDPYEIEERIAIKMESGMTEKQCILEDNQRRIMLLAQLHPGKPREPRIPPMLDRKSMAAGEHDD